MFGKKDKNDGTDTEVNRREITIARGGIAPWAILTGVVVAYGAFSLIFAIVGGAFAASGVEADELTSASREIGIGVAIGALVSWFLAFLWGGYTAGRMGRGAGILNGILVPILFLVIGGIVAALVAAFGETANLQLPFTQNQLPIRGSELYEYSIAFSIAILAAMLIGGILGGGMGQRWHKKLERRTLHDEEQRVEGQRQSQAQSSTGTVDLRDRSTQGAAGTTSEQQQRNS